VAAIREEQARAAMMAQADAAVERIRDGEPVDAVAADLGYEWQVEIAAERNAPMLPRPVAELAFAMQVPADGDAAVDVTLGPTGDALVVEVSGVTPGDYAALPEARQQRVRQQVRGEFATLVQGEYQQHLREESDISVY
jgi:peptidyl-prolyl cis-trans isomerase D